MAWPDADYDANGELLSVALDHCPCDGYAPPPGGQPLTPWDFETELGPNLGSIPGQPSVSPATVQPPAPSLGPRGSIEGAARSVRIGIAASVVGDEPGCAGAPTTDGQAEDHRLLNLPIEEDYPASAWDAESAVENSRVDL